METLSFIAAVLLLAFITILSLALIVMIVIIVISVILDSHDARRLRAFTTWFDQKIIKRVCLMTHERNRYYVEEGATFAGTIGMDAFCNLCTGFTRIKTRNYVEVSPWGHSKQRLYVCHLHAKKFNIKRPSDSWYVKRLTRGN